MNFHPHIHTILLGGGLTPDNRWKDNGENFFLPIQVISKVFCGKYLEELKRRIVRMDDDTVTFSVKDYRNEGQWKELTISGVDAPPEERAKELSSYCHRHIKEEKNFSLSVSQKGVDMRIGVDFIFYLSASRIF